ncbi:hypothetical protein EV360DRAFT_89761 [Lentinula raphanica]|nr:hypothetical protein EV360DRAFT_89761 [Lentinula raphanica]
MDVIDEAFATGIISTDVGKKTLNKYYELTDDSHLYCIAIVLHPSLKLDYCCIAGWPETWINRAVAITRERWEGSFKPSHPAGSTAPSTPDDQAPQLLMTAMNSTVIWHTAVSLGSIPCAGGCRTRKSIQTLLDSLSQYILYQLAPLAWNVPSPRAASSSCLISATGSVQAQSRL